MNGGSVRVIDIPVAPEFLWFILAALIIFFIIVAIVLTYHWRNYGVQHNPKVFAKSLFWIISIMFIIVMMFAASAFDYNL